MDVKGSKILELKANTEGKAKGELPNLGNYTVKCIAEDFKDSEQQRGSLDPISANNTEENRKKNRRVEFVVL